MPFIGPVFRGAYAGGTQHRFVPRYSTASAPMGPVRRRRPVARRGANPRSIRGIRAFQRVFRRRVAMRRRPSSSNFAETKFLPLAPANEATPAAIQVGAKAYFKGFVIGTRPSSWSSGPSDLGGISITKGVDANQRIGNYVYLKHTLVNLNIDMKLNTDVAPPQEFRVIVFRQRREAMPAGVNPDPAGTLFLTEAGGSTGHVVGGINGTDLMLQPLNKEKWIIVRDQKFTLQKPNHGQDSFGNGGYKNSKNFRISLGYRKKAHYESANLPTNVPYHYGIFIYARSLDKDHNASNWEVNLRGSTLYNDV